MAEEQAKIEAQVAEREAKKAEAESVLRRCAAGRHRGRAPDGPASIHAAPKSNASLQRWQSSRRFYGCPLYCPYYR